MSAFPGNTDNIPLTPQLSPKNKELNEYTSGSLSPRNSVSWASSSKQPIEKSKDLNVEVRSASGSSTTPEPALDEPLCTTSVLQQFNSVRERNAKRAAVKDRDSWIKEDIKLTPRLQKLRNWRRTKKDGFFDGFRSSGRPKPTETELEELALHYFPPRGKLNVRIIDFGNGFSRVHTATTLAEVEKFVGSKPDDIDVRWIHAPLGPGLTLSSVEDIFLNAKHTRRHASVVGGSQSWPYQEVEVLNFRDRDEYNTMREIFDTVCKESFKNESLRERLNEESRGTMSDGLADDLSWRAKHLGQTSNYAELVGSDIPYHLTQLPTLEAAHGPMDGPKPLNAQHVEQTLWNHPFYRSAQLVRNKLRCFHRPDGVLLTMSAAAGVDYLDKDLKSYLKYSRRKRMESEEASVLGFLFKRFEQTGTRDWDEPTVEWFLTYVLTEYSVTPHTIRQGRNAIMITSAYQAVVEQLKMRRYEEFKRHESVKLVKEYLTCTDELTSIVQVLKGKVSMLKQLLKNVERDEQQLLAVTERDEQGLLLSHKPSVSSRWSLPREHKDREPGCLDSARERIEWALSLVEDQDRAFQSLLDDLRLATEALFQLRSIEQNELAIVADSQNKAILVFTGVTIVFLPLSFFTGYYGMNLKGIQDTNKDEKWFWKVCGIVAFVIIGGSMIYAFRHRLRVLRMFRRRALDRYLP